MKLTKKLKAEVLKVYHTYWESYTNGDIKTFAGTLDRTFEMIGTTESEICHTREDGIKFMKAQVKELLGKVQMRNRKISLVPVNELMLVNEQCDIYFLNGRDWSFYSKIRISTFLRKTTSGWKVFQQHGSLPDMRVQEGETLAVKKISKENLQLKEAIKRRTVELEQKNRELEIEASLERVRAVAMGMKKSDDLLSVCKTGFRELKKLGFADLRNMIIHTYVDEQKYFNDYDYSDALGGAVAKVPYTGNPVIEKFIRTIRKGKSAFSEIKVTGKQLEDWKKFRKANKEPVDPRLNKAKALYYYIYSVGSGSIGVSTFSPIDDTKRSILIRFRNVFDLSYQRYLDIQKAEAQAREAQIQLALERVRARTMAMHHSDELADVVKLLYQEFDKLKISNESTDVEIGLIDEETGIAKVWAHLYLSDGSISAFNFPFAHFDSINDEYKKWKSTPVEKRNELFITTEFSGKLWNKFKKLAREVPELVDMFESLIAGNIKKWITHNAYFSHGLLTLQGTEHYSQETQEILKRFAKVFEQTYTRFLDLQKAEAQAREAQVEAALEKVRSRSLAMHKSDELEEVIMVVSEQLQQLKFRFHNVSFGINNERQDFNFWMASPGVAHPFLLAVPYIDNPAITHPLQARSKGIDFISDILSFEENKAWLQHLFEYSVLKNVSEDHKNFLLATKSFARSQVLNRHTILTIGNYAGVPYTDEQNDILKRFGNVFEQAYTRFLDLQKAEAQSREAQIELGLERVRARAMAMQKSDELSELVDTVFKELTKLDFALNWCIINIIDESSLTNMVWAANPETNKPPESYLMKFEDYPFHHSMMKGYQERKTKHVYVLEGKEKKIYDDYLFNKTEWRRVPKAAQAASRAMKRYVATFTFSNFGGLQTVGEEYLSEGNLDILSRFGKVFNLTYTRFNDLQKAEAQAREAQIQLALERVRARSMAMHKSDELADLSLELVKQVQALGVATWFCAFNIYDDDPKGSLEWGSNGQGTFPQYRTPREGIFLRYYKAGQKGEALLINEIGENECPAHYDYLCSLPGVGEQLLGMKAAGIPFPSFQIDHVAFFKYGYLLFITYEPVPEAHDIFKRFAKVFEQTYTRFLDLQKAETQAREAQIEAALERVRSRSLAMHKTDELQEVVRVVAEELKNTGVILDTWGAVICTYFQDSKDVIHWTATEDPANPSIAFLLPYFKDELFDEAWASKNKGDSYFAKVFSFDVKNEFFNHAFEHSDYRQLPDEYKKLILESKSHGIAWAWSKNSAIMIPSIQGDLPSEEEKEILIRFAKVFEQSFIRFLDLQKAEAQAREAKIEAALERIRGKVTAMQESSELLDIVVSMRREFVALSHGADYFWYMRWLPDKYEKAMTSGDGSRIGMVMTLPRHIHGDIKLVADWEKSDESSLVFPMDVDTAVDYVDKMITLGDFQQVDPQAPTLDDIRHIGGLTFIMARTTHGEIGYSLTGVVPNPPEEDVNTLVRFAAVFDLAYRRFEDLKEAERRNRETQIELALERVRSRTMAMHKSAELKEVIKVVFEQFVHLNINVGHAGFYIDYKVHDDMHIWLADPNIEPFYVTLPYFDTPTWHSFLEAKRNGTALHTDLLNFEEKNNFYNSLFKLFTVPDEAKKFYLECKGLAVSTVLLDNVGLYIENFDAVPYSEEENNILMRFGKVFQQTYTRFLDLQRAEAQAREAQIEAALEKVRSRSLAMQQPNELTEVAELLRKEMGQLGVEELETSSIYIVDKENEQAECWYAIKDIREESKNLVSDEMTITFADTWVGNEMGRFYGGKKEQISIVMKGDKRKEWINYCAEKSKVLQGYYGDEIPERTYHLVKFNGGYMGAASPGDISAESWDLLRRASSVFSLAYTRFNDLKIAEAHALQAEKDLIAIKEAKQKAEEALGELQATQKQLIQSEKMASLGELTAGIAHEIQNPLNFVNNFSEVSKELLDEMKEELEKGNVDDAKEIMIDVIQNLEKINHHGKRADGIVKGMLQHSRSSSGQKEPTDINALCDEYLRLAYHGLRAKDKNFNAKFEASFDEAIGKINILPQDLGRVVLNLINNAFYAVSERKNAGEQGYEPVVTVSTRKVGNAVEIKVRDNGTGIPQKALDKIFQPFFTTKPTGQGTGLGLSLSYDIVTKGHGGELKVETKEGEGTEFIVVLPV